MKPSTNERTIQISRVFDLPLKKVWQAWTEPEEFKKWWGPEGYSCPSCSIDLTEGGLYLSCMRSEEGDDFWSTGIFKEIIPFKKLVFTDNFADEKGKVIPASALKMPGKWPKELLITVFLEEENGKIRMNFIHEGVPIELQNDCTSGWQQSFGKLERNVK